MNLKNRINDLQEIRQGYFSANTEQRVQDTRWDFTRTVTVRRSLVVILSALLLITNQAFWHLKESTDFLRAIGFGTIILELIVFGLLRVSVRAISDTPSEFIDEREIRQKEQAHFYAYKVMEVLWTLLFIALFLNFITADSSWINRVDWTSDKFVAVSWVTTALVGALPTVLLAWRSKDR